MIRHYTTLAFLLLLGAAGFGQDTPLWLRYPALSPDGAHIVFNYKGDLYKVASTGGRAMALTHDAAHDYRAVWSADGQQLAFASNRHGNFDVFVMSAEGGRVRRLTYHSANEVPSSFSPDGQFVLFGAQIQDAHASVQFPSAQLAELYQVPFQGGPVQQVLSTPAHHAQWAPNQQFLVYEDVKGYENEWRKHHQSAITRDLWLYHPQTRKHTPLAHSPAEDRNPVLSADGQSVYFLSERAGSNFNVFRLRIDAPQAVEQLTQLDKHPVRSLSVSSAGTLCFSYNGELYTQQPGQQPQRVPIQLFEDTDPTANEFQKLSSGASEMSVSPDGTEVALVVRGEVYVASVKYGTTKRITNTPGQERSVSFSPDGKSLLYAAERTNRWALYKTERVRAEEKNFSNSTLLREETVYAPADEDCFQPSFAPNGKEVAFLSDRTALRVIDLGTRAVRTVLDGRQAYSYSDGDQWYEWSPDSKWFAVMHSPTHFTRDNLGIVAADGRSALRTVLVSGYSDRVPHWSADGTMLYWFTDRQGLRSHGSWGSQFDVYGLFLTQAAFDDFRLSEEAFALLKGAEKDKKDSTDTKNPKETKDKKDKKPKDVQIEWDGLENRYLRLTLHPSDLADAIVDKKNEKMYYLSRFEKGFDLWEAELRQKSVKKLLSLDGGGGAMQLDQDNKNLFLFSGGQVIKVELAGTKKSTVSFSAEFERQRAGEYRYFFDHVWRTVRQKWYHPELHQVDWAFYYAAYERFLPHIDNHFDFAELLSELLGELNGSHTGAGYRPPVGVGDQTASLGILIDWSYTGPGWRVAEVLENGPLHNAQSKVRPGAIIERINNLSLQEHAPYQLLNHQANKNVVLSLSHNGKTWDEVLRPITQAQQNELLYERWVKTRAAAVEKLSNGRLGYTHVRGMNGPSFRRVYSEVLGPNAHKEALIVDTRYNGGGWLHDDLATLLSGREYVSYWPRNGKGEPRKMGADPLGKWTKPSCVLMSEGNYSDAHAFPYAYKTLGIGKLVGMPVPGTMTAVWWETLHDPTLYYGIPQVGARDTQGRYLENQQLEPDLRQANEYDQVANGTDQQLETAVRHLLSILGQ